jgi:hypothetical protein
MAFRKFFLEQRSITVFRFSKNLHDVEKVWVYLFLIDDHIYKIVWQLD